MDAFEAELALDRLEAEVAAELPAHMRAFAAAYAAGQPAPAAPESSRRGASIDTVRRVLGIARQDSVDPESVAVPPREHLSLEHELPSRALSLLRLLAPVAIEDDPRVAAARAAAPSWESWATLAAARDAAARSRFGVGHVALMHDLHGCAARDAGVAAHDRAAHQPPWPEPLPGWHEAAPVIEPRIVENAWRDLATRHGAQGRFRIVHADVRPRTFVVEPGREVIVVAGAIETPAARFAILHELGHAIAALIVPWPIARVVDEAAAAYVARLLEHEGALDLALFTPIATPARARRLQISRVLDAIEHGGPDRPTATPPWALWDDPGAQAAYVAAEAIAEHWWIELGAMPPAGALADAITTVQRRIDQAGSALIT